MQILHEWKAAAQLSEGINSEGERGALGSLSERDIGEDPPPHPTLGIMGERRELSQQGPGQSPGRKRFYFYRNLITADRL